MQQNRSSFSCFFHLFLLVVTALYIPIILFKSYFSWHDTHDKIPQITLVMHGVSFLTALPAKWFTLFEELDSFHASDLPSDVGGVLFKANQYADPSDKHLNPTCRAAFVAVRTQPAVCSGQGSGSPEPSPFRGRLEERSGCTGNESHGPADHSCWRFANGGEEHSCTKGKARMDFSAR